MIKKQPVFLNLMQIRFPITAMISILHRISGLGLFVLLPGLLFIWQESLSSAERFLEVRGYFNEAWVKGLVWFFCVGLFYHLVAGVRHLIMDCGFAESRDESRFTAKGVLVISIAFGIAIAWKLFN